MLIAVVPTLRVGSLDAVGVAAAPILASGGHDGDPGSHGDQQLHEILPSAVRLLAGRRLAVLTGAGISTDSGIPDYRGPTSTGRMPMNFTEFLTPRGRQRYWARSFVGWQRMREASPNAGHAAVVRLQPLLSGLITQNVDGLHTAAGSPSVLDLHGRIDTVVCLNCSRRSPRRDYQSALAARNPLAERADDLVAEQFPRNRRCLLLVARRRSHRCP